MIAKGGSGSDSHNVIENCSTAIKGIETTEKGIYDSIKAILNRLYAVFVEHTKASSTFSEVKTTDFKLPAGILTTECPMKAQEFIKVIRSLVHNHPYQAWAIIPTLERIFA